MQLVLLIPKFLISICVIGEKRILNCDYSDITRIKVLIIPVIVKCDDSNGFFVSEELGNSNDWDSHDSAVMLNVVTCTFTSDVFRGYGRD